MYSSSLLRFIIYAVQSVKNLIKYSFFAAPFCFENNEVLKIRTSFYEIQYKRLAKIKSRVDELREWNWNGMIF